MSEKILVVDIETTNFLQRGGLIVEVGIVELDTETGESQACDNEQNVNAPQGAGIQASKTVVDLEADALIAANVGPKAFAVLKEAGVDVFVGAKGTVKDAVEAFKAGTLSPTRAANREGHWV